MWHTLPLLLVFLPATATQVSHLLSPWVLCTLPEPEARAEACEVAAAGLPCGGLTEPEEGVTLHGALPQVFATLGAGQLEHKGVLLLPSLKKTSTHCWRTGVCVFVSMHRLAFSWQDKDLIVVLHHDQSEATLFKVQSSDFWPEKHKARSKIRVQWCSSNTSMKCDFYCESLQICFSADLKRNYELKQFHLLECTFQTMRQKNGVFSCIFFIPV